MYSVAKFKIDLIVWKSIEAITETEKAKSLK